jgi:hypothetical protein
MPFHQQRCGGFVAPPQRRQNFTVLVHGTLGGMRPPVEREDHRTARHHLAKILFEQSVVGEPSEGRVKFSREADRYTRIITPCGNFFFPNSTLELGAEFRPPPGNHQADHLPLEDDAHAERIARLLEGRPRHHCGSAVAPLDQTFPDEASQRYPDKGPADPEMGAELILAELGAWLERLLDNGAMERLVRSICTLGGPLHVRALRSDGPAGPRNRK